MAKLNAKRRRKLKKSQFAAPKGRGPDKSKNQYPIHDRAHAIAAKARSTQAMKKGRISRAMRDRIHARANRVLKRTRSR